MLDAGCWIQDDLSLSSISYPVSYIRNLYKQNGMELLDALRLITRRHSSDSRVIRIQRNGILFRPPSLLPLETDLNRDAVKITEQAEIRIRIIGAEAEIIHLIMQPPAQTYALFLIQA